MIKVEKGMRFRFKSKYDDCYYFGVVGAISAVVNSEYAYFYSEKNIG